MKNITAMHFVECIAVFVSKIISIVRSLILLTSICRCYNDSAPVRNEESDLQLNRPMRHIVRVPVLQERWLRLA